MIPGFELQKLITLCLMGMVAMRLSICQAAELRDLKVLYIGSSPRAQDFEAFLRPRVAKIELMNRWYGFDPAKADPFDVVILDWPQSERSPGEKVNKSPLGKRDTWGKPTLLLGSAGLHMGTVWEVNGGSG